MDGARVTCSCGARATVSLGGFGIDGNAQMLTIYGNQKARFCDGLSRRNFLKIGGRCMGGLALPPNFQAQAQTGIPRSDKTGITHFLSGWSSDQALFGWRLK